MQEGKGRCADSGHICLMDVVADGKVDVGDCLIRTNIPNLVSGSMNKG